MEENKCNCEPCTCTDECASGYNPNCTCTNPECHCTEK